jgi:hypothetical protein
MEMSQGNFLYFKQIKMSCFFFIFSLLQSWRTGGQNESCPEGRIGTSGSGEMAGKGGRMVNTVVKKKCVCMYINAIVITVVTIP